MLPENEVKDFYQNYREMLSRQYETAKQNLERQRENDFTSIMTGANKAGMLYSNFPERSKIQYDAGTYMPSYAKLNTTYQTGLDALRENVLKYQNSIKDIQEAIDALNKSYQSKTTS